MNIISPGVSKLKFLLFLVCILL